MTMDRITLLIVLIVSSIALYNSITRNYIYPKCNTFVGVMMADGKTATMICTGY